MWNPTKSGVWQISMLINASCYAIVTHKEQWSVSDFSGEFDVNGDAPDEESAKTAAENAILVFILTKLLSFASKEKIIGILNAISQ